MVINEIRWRRMVPHSFYEISYPLNRESIIFENHHLAAGASKRNDRENGGSRIS